VSSGDLGELLPHIDLKILDQGAAQDQVQCSAET
jgi:hypothetical protein